MTQLRAGRGKGGTLLAVRSRAAGSGVRGAVFAMGTTLDIKIKRANKVYHAGIKKEKSFICQFIILKKNFKARML